MVSLLYTIMLGSAHCRAFHDRSCGEGWRNKYRGQSCNTLANQELQSVRTAARAVKDKSPTFVQGSGAEIQTKIRLSASSFTPLHELIRAKFIRFDTYPREFRPGYLLFFSYTFVDPNRRWKVLLSQQIRDEADEACC